MRGERFDRLVWALGVGFDRRRAAAGLIAGVGTGVLGLGPGTASKCTKGGGRCRASSDCCSKACFAGTCADEVSRADLTPVAERPTAPQAHEAAVHVAANQVVIQAADGWVAAPLSLQAGQRFAVNYVSGTWTVDARNFPTVGPDGYDQATDSQIYQGCKVIAALPYARLLGKVGNGSVFSVGDGATFTADATGGLSLRINDDDACLADNAGSVTMSVDASDADGCAGSDRKPTGAACSSDAMCCSGYCERNGACTRKKGKKRHHKKRVLTGACRCAERCGQDSGCASDDICRTGVCNAAQCGTTPISCRLRTVVVVPSDVTNLPNDATIRARTDAALATVSNYYAAKAGLSLRYDASSVLHASHDSGWFSATTGGQLARARGIEVPKPVPEPWDPYRTRGNGNIQPAASLPAINLDRMAAYLDEVGYGGICDDSWTTLIVAATTLGGGYAGGLVCGSVLHHTPNSGPSAGPGAAGACMVSQWVLEVILTGEDSPSCKNEMGSDYWACPANVGWGTIVHELGHSLGLPHPCEGWYHDNWQYSDSTCANLIMQSHWNYPTAGFSDNEKAILRLNPTLE